MQLSLAMNPERWKQIEEVYYSVVASPSTGRSSLLDELCRDDPDMRREVESLLEAREQAGTFLSPAHLCDGLKELEAEWSLVGRAFGHYQILSAIGAGAMGEVYLAADTRLDRRVALKVLPSQFTRNPSRVARFQREAKAASALNHPNIMSIYDIGEIRESWFIAAEFIPGETIRERLSAGRLDPQAAVDIALQCAVALEAAHEAGILHRDIKPENIMVRPDGLVKVVDFGLARVAAEQAASADATQAGILIGTPRYMSPEQARGERLDGRADIFSLGAVLYEMLSGRRAFSGDTAPEVFASILNSAPGPPSQQVGGIPDALDRIVLRALTRDREERYRTMRELAADLRQLTPWPSPAVRTPRKRKKLSMRLRRLRLIAAAGAGALIAGLGWYAYSHRLATRQETPNLSVVPLTSFEGYKDFGSLSPDGNRVAFSWNGGAGGSGGKMERSIYAEAIGKDDPVRLTFTDQDDRFPAWSPDGRSIAFCRALTQVPDPSRYAILLIPSSGGKEEKVAEGGRGVSWSPDGNTLAFSDSAAGSGGIVLLSLKTRERLQLTSPRPFLDNLPVFSPDGRWIVFTRDFGFSAREIYIVRATGGAAKRLTFDREPTYGTAWTADSREIVFASNRGIGGESLWRIRTDGAAPRRLSATLEGGFYPSISRTGKRLVYTQASKDTNIDGYAGPGFAKGPVPGRFGSPTALIVSSRRDDSPSISPAADRIAFVSKRTGNEEIWICDASGKHLKQLTAFKGPATGTPRWSPDGSSIAFDSTAAGNPDIYLMNVAAGAARRLTAGPASNFMPSWSPDGKWIYFKSNRSGSDQIWKIPSGAGSAVQLTHGGATEALASPDGKLVYFTRRAWGAIWQVSVDGGLEEPLPELAHFDRIFRSWGVIGRGIYFMSQQDTPRQTVRFFDFATQHVTPLVSLDKQPIWDYPDVSLSRDGRLLLFACLDQEVNDLMLIENFH